MSQTFTDRNPAQDFIQILGLSPDEVTAIKSLKNERQLEAVLSDRYRELARFYHEDRNKGPHAQEAADRFKEMQNAYDVLTDKDSKDSFFLFASQVAAGQLQYKPSKYAWPHGPSAGRTTWDGPRPAGGQQRTPPPGGAQTPGNQQQRGNTPPPNNTPPPGPQPAPNYNHPPIPPLFMMSRTLLDSQLLGAHQVGSPLPPGNRPMGAINQRMNGQTNGVDNNGVTFLVVKRVNDLPGEDGLIHTHVYKLGYPHEFVRLNDKTGEVFLKKGAQGGQPEKFNAFSPDGRNFPLGNPATNPNVTRVPSVKAPQWGFGTVCNVTVPDAWEMDTRNEFSDMLTRMGETDASVHSRGLDFLLDPTVPPGRLDLGVVSRLSLGGAPGQQQQNNQQRQQQKTPPPKTQQQIDNENFIRQFYRWGKLGAATAVIGAVTAVTGVMGLIGYEVYEHTGDRGSPTAQGPTPTTKNPAKSPLSGVGADPHVTKAVVAQYNGQVEVTLVQEDLGSSITKKDGGWQVSTPGGNYVYPKGTPVDIFPLRKNGIGKLLDGATQHVDAAIDSASEKDRLRLQGFFDRDLDPSDQHREVRLANEK